MGPRVCIHVVSRYKIMETARRMPIAKEHGKKGIYARTAEFMGSRAIRKKGSLRGKHIHNEVNFIHDGS